MENVKQLFIRACKSADANKRVKSVYRRFYLSMGDDQESTRAMCGVLSSIVDKYCPMTSCELIDKLGPSSEWKYPGVNYHEKVLKVLISKIGLTKVDCFDGLTKPAKFRNAA